MWTKAPGAAGFITGMESMKKEKNKNSRKTAAARQSKRTILGITAVVCVLMAVLLVQGSSLRGKLAANENREQELQQQIDAEQQRTEEIEDLQDYMKSDEYAEKTAREKLGLVKDGEILFKEAD